MDVREKLIEIVCDAMESDGCIGHCNHSPCFEVERVVNALIDKGVTVQENVEISDELLKQLKNAPITICKEEPSIELVQEWISVDDRLPDDNDRVIAFSPNEPETSAYKYRVMWGWNVKASLKHRGIAHWCYLPQPPKGE